MFVWGRPTYCIDLQEKQDASVASGSGILDTPFPLPASQVATPAPQTFKSILKTTTSALPDYAVPTTGVISNSPTPEFAPARLNPIHPHIAPIISVPAPSSGSSNRDHSNGYGSDTIAVSETQDSTTPPPKKKGGRNPNK